MSFFNSSCNDCKYRQTSLDPEGCFILVSTTGWFGRLYRRIMGCKSYKKQSYIRRE
jgi:hypothetical protein